MYNKELGRVVTQLISETAMTNKLTAPKQRFVLKENWDETLDGKFEEKKVVWHDVFGVSKEGIWCTSGREGVYELEASDSTTTRSIAVVDDGTGPFAEQRHEKLKATFQTAREKEDKDRRDVCVKSPELPTSHDMLQLLQKVTGGLPAAGDYPPGVQDTKVGSAAPSGLASASGLVDPTCPSPHDDDEDEEEQTCASPIGRKKHFLAASSSRLKTKANIVMIRARTIQTSLAIYTATRAELRDKQQTTNMH